MDFRQHVGLSKSSPRPWAAPPNSAKEEMHESRVASHASGATSRYGIPTGPPEAAWGPQLVPQARCKQFWAFFLVGFLRFLEAPLATTAFVFEGPSRDHPFLRLSYAHIGIHFVENHDHQSETVQLNLALGLQAGNIRIKTMRFNLSNCLSPKMLKIQTISLWLNSGRVYESLRLTPSVNHTCASWDG